MDPTMDQSIQMQQINAPRQQRPLILLLTLIFAIGAGYTACCFYLGKEYKSAYTNSIKKLRQIPGVTVGRTKIKTSIFSSSAKTPIIYKVGPEKVRLVLKSYARHTPIPFGKGYGRLVDTRSILEMTPHSKKMFKPFLEKPFRVILRHRYHFNSSQSLSGRLLPLKANTPALMADLKKSITFAADLEEGEEISQLAFKIPNMLLNIPRFGNFEFGDMQFRQQVSTRKLSLTLWDRLKWKKFNATLKDRWNRDISTLTSTDGNLDFAVTGLNRMRMFRKPKNLATMLFSPKSRPMTRLVKAIRSSPELNLHMRSLRMNTPDGQYSLKGKMGLAKNNKKRPPVFMPFENMYMKFNFKAPTASIAKLVTSYKGRKSLNRLIRQGVLINEGGFYTSAFDYRNRQLIVNDRPLNPMLLTGLR